MTGKGKKTKHIYTKNKGQ